jgi:uncharacterized coiled-coil DUF342 family protein
VAQRKDQIFQLSLTEIAFTIVFILLLLLGHLVFKEQKERQVAEEALAKMRSIDDAVAGLNAAKSSFVSALQSAGGSASNDIITKLVAANEVRAERDRLKKQVDDLDAKLTSLTELQNQLNKAVQSGGSEITNDVIKSALSLQNMLFEHAMHNKGSDSLIADSKPTREQFNKEAIERVKQAISITDALKKQIKVQLEQDLDFGKEEQAIQDIVAAAKKFSDLVVTNSNQEPVKKENADLRGQVAFLKKKLESRGGRDYPPCWADEKTGKVEFLFSIDVTPENIVVVPAWPSNRESDARSLPGLLEILSSSPLSNVNFVQRVQGIYKKSQGEQCRHYVQLKSSIADAVKSDRARLMIENYFYKVEIRR